MKANVPTNINYLKIIVRVCLAILVGITSSYISGEIYAGIVTFIAILLALPLLSRSKLNYQFKRHLSTFGEKYNKDITDEVYEESVFGFVPFGRKAVSCFVYANELGVLIRKRNVNRYLSWGSIEDCEPLEYMGYPVLRLTLERNESLSKLVIPWRLEFDKYLQCNS